MLTALLSNEEAMVDSVIVCTLIGIVALIGFQTAQVWHDPTSFNPVNFGGAVASIMGAGGAVKTCRERFRRDADQH